MRDPRDKILPREELARRLAAERPGRRVVLANGLFDLTHVGHLRYLEAAATEGDILVVAINDDGSARAARGPGRPLVPAAERAVVVAGFGCVDYVTLFPEGNAAETLLALRPQVHAKGTDYRPGTLPAAEREALHEIGGRVAITGDPKSHSTRDLVAVVLERYSALSS